MRNLNTTFGVLQIKFRIDNLVAELMFRIVLLMFSISPGKIVSCRIMRTDYLRSVNIPVAGVTIYQMRLATSIKPVTGSKSLFTPDNTRLILHHNVLICRGIVLTQGGTYLTYRAFYLTYGGIDLTYGGNNITLGGIDLTYGGTDLTHGRNNIT